MKYGLNIPASGALDTILKDLQQNTSGRAKMDE